MTATRTTRPRIVTSNRLYAVAILTIGMAIPHLAIGLEAHWPGQLMSLHILLIVLLLLAGVRTELAETHARRAPAPGAPTDEFDNLTQQLRDLER